MTDLDTGAEASGSDDLRSALESAWTADATPETPPAPKSETPDKPTAADTTIVAKTDDRPRNPDGTFAEKAKETVSEKPVSTDQAAPAPETGQPATRKPPASWSKEYHDHWNKLDPAIQDQILKRESDVAKGFEEKAAKYKPYDELEPLLAQKRQFWRLNGWSDAQAIQQLLAAQDYLERDTVGAIRWLASSYGVRPEQLIQQTAASNPADPLAQYLAPVFQELQQVKATLTAREKAEHERETQSVLSQIESFASSKDHPHFETVQADMMALLSNDGAQNSPVAERLKNAYDKAVWLNPDIRKQILDDQAKAQAVKNAEEVEKAKRAASSVTGAPTGGSARTGPAPSLREELEAAFG